MIKYQNIPAKMFMKTLMKFLVIFLIERKSQISKFTIERPTIF